MRIAVLDAKIDADYIRQVRCEIVQGLGLPESPGLVDPLPHAVYLAMYPMTGIEPIGMAEAYFLDQVFPRLEEYGPARALDFAALAPFEQSA